jgi:hypothetical protein
MLTLKDATETSDVLGLHGTAWAATKERGDFAGRFTTAPEAAPDQ